METSITSVMTSMGSSVKTFVQISEDTPMETILETLFINILIPFLCSVSGHLAE